MPANNPHQNSGGSPVDPAKALVAITPDDSNDLATVVRDIRVGGAGNVVVIDAAGNTVTFSGCVAGERLGPFYVARVKLTGTTATNLIGYL